MKVAVTGANGIVGKALLSQLDKNKFAITPLDLPEHDASDRADLIAATEGHDVLIHLAWNTDHDNYDTGDIDPDNNLMTFNAYKAAIENGIPRVIMASSNHAHRHDIRDTDGQIRASIQPPVPDSPYGAEKVLMEAFGRYAVHTHGVEVVCIRIGSVTEDDTPHPTSSDQPSCWLSYRDLGRLVTACLDAKTVPNGFSTIYGVSKQAVFDWSNPFGYEPLDSDF